MTNRLLAMADAGPSKSPPRLNTGSGRPRKAVEATKPVGRSKLTPEARAANIERRKAEARTGRVHFESYGRRGMNFTIPPHVEAEGKRAREYVHPNIVGNVCGDPPPWRSALARRVNG